MGLLHKHAPVGTGAMITIGFRKENLPRGTWSFLCIREMLVCDCHRKFIRIGELLQELLGTYDSH